MAKPIEIVVVSGKGGTGKTVLASSLAALIDDLVVADCDVDAPDMHLLLEPTIVRHEVFSGSKVASIDPDTCISCATCAEVCRFGAVNEEISGKARAYSIDGLACEGCGVCAWNCPSGAIDLGDAPTGNWYVSRTRFGKMIHARLGVAQETSGKLVTVVRREARCTAIADRTTFVLIDGPPGIGCPVIASIAGADLAVIVTEPTLSGLHDLKRILGLTKHFELRTAVVINKYDLNSEMCTQIQGFLEEQKIPLAGKIRFDGQVNKAIAAGKTIVEYSDSEAAREIKRIADWITRSIHTGQGARTR
ncbi:MAG: ATP-binding protein [Candidatus Eisenbacteria bacterium]